MEEIAISTFKATCLEVLERVRQTGEPLVMTRRGKPVAQVHPPPPSPPSPEPKDTSRFGCMRGTAEIMGDIVGPVPGQDWNALR